MKNKHIAYLTVFSLAAIFLLGTLSNAFSNPIVLNFQIEDPQNGQFNNAEFSYIIDKDYPFWSNIEGTSFGDQNYYKYNVQIFKADTILGNLPDLTLKTSQMIGDVESGITEFFAGNYTDGNYMNIFTCTTWYLWDLIDPNNINQHVQFYFISQTLELPGSMGWTNYPYVWLSSIEAYPEPVPEPSTIVLFCTAMACCIVGKRTNDAIPKAKIRLILNSH